MIKALILPCFFIHFFSAHKDYESLSEESRKLIDSEYSSDQCVG